MCLQPVSNSSLVGFCESEIVKWAELQTCEAWRQKKRLGIVMNAVQLDSESYSVLNAIDKISSIYYLVLHASV